MTTNQTISFPRELSDELGELIAEKARVCGGGAFDIWEAICEKFGTPAAQPRGDSVTIEAVAVTRDNADGGLRLEWLLEGGISQMEFAGMVLFAIPEANDLCDEDGSAEVYLTPPQAEQIAPVAVAMDERQEFVAWVRREWPQAPLSNVRDLLPKDDPRYGEYCDEALQRAWVGWQARANANTKTR